MNLDFEKFKILARDHNLIPLYDILPADMDTPVSAFLKIRSGKHDFLYESVVGGEKWARYSFLGTGLKKVYQLNNGRFFCFEGAGRKVRRKFERSPLEVFREDLRPLTVWQDSSLPRFFGGFVGYIGYESSRWFENITFKNPERLKIPELCMMLADTVVIFDNLGQVLKIVNSVMLPDGARRDAKKLKSIFDTACGKIEGLKKKLLRPPHPPFGHPLPQGERGIPVHEKQSATESEYCAVVERVKEYIAAGDIFQAVLSLQFEMRAKHVDPFQVYRALRRINPSPYMYYLSLGGLDIAGASPEVLVRLEGTEIQVRPIAGTRRRGEDDRSDFELEQELRTDPKERAEHIMLVDLGRNDVGKVAKNGSVRVEENELIERYSHVMHLVSHVKGELRSDKDVFDVIAAAFPAGTLTGAPKVRAMQIIDELEQRPRVVYGGGVGYISFSGNTDMAIAIRTAVFHQNKITVQAGAGVVYNSVPELEYRECLNKAQAVLAAIKNS